MEIFNAAKQPHLLLSPRWTLFTLVLILQQSGFQPWTSKDWKRLLTMIITIFCQDLLPSGKLKHNTAQHRRPDNCCIPNGSEVRINILCQIVTVSFRYANWVTDKVIQRELYQNIGSSMIAIFITVLIFLGSFRGACFVIFCVFATIVEVAGFMYFWGLTIDVITCNTLVISIGLCVDFSAHIAHGFISRTGTR